MTTKTRFVRTADDDDRLAIFRLVEGALLDVDPGTVTTAIETDQVLVADDPITGTLIVDRLDGDAHIPAIAVHPNHRRQGIGTAVVSEAADRWGRLSETFDERVYAVLDFSISKANGRWHGIYTPPE